MDFYCAPCCSMLKLKKKLCDFEKMSAACCSFITKRMNEMRRSRKCRKIFLSLLLSAVMAFESAGTAMVSAKRSLWPNF